MKYPPEEQYPGPHDAGEVVLAAVAPVFYVMHTWRERCPTEEPHMCDSCGEFEPPRLGYEPDPEPPRLEKVIRWMRDWDSIYARLDAGASMFSLLDEFSIAVPVVNNLLPDADPEAEPAVVLDPDLPFR